MPAGVLARLAFALALACGCTAQLLQSNSLRTITLGAAPSTTSGLRYFVCGNVSIDGVVISVNQAKVAVSEASSSSGWQTHYTEDLSLMLSNVYTTPQLLGGGCTQSLLVLYTRCCTFEPLAATVALRGRLLLALAQSSWFLLSSH
jgi:hypothetical protein